LVAGIGPPPVDISPPEDIISDNIEGSIVGAQQELRILTVEELRVDPARASEVLR